MAWGLALPGKMGLYSKDKQQLHMSSQVKNRCVKARAWVVIILTESSDKDFCRKL